MRLRVFLFASLIGIAVAACGGGTTDTFVGIPTASPSGAPTAIPTALATTQALGSGAALVEQPVATSVPAPAGYTASVNAPLVTANANTTISIKAGAAAPANVPVIAGSRRPANLKRYVSGQYNAAYYDVLVPSASITVAGTVSITQGFPAGALSASTNYYLAFYDGTQASPTWQTISGPATESNNALTFSGNVGSFTLQQGGTYAFCIFSVASGSSATPPPSQAQDEAYLSQYQNGILVVNASGSTLNTLSIDSNTVVLDDAGNLYNLYDPPAPSPSPGATATPTAPPAVLQYYAAGSTTPSKTYDVNPSVGYIEGSGSGEVVGTYNTPIAGSNSFNLNMQVWNAGSAGGAPDYTIVATQYGSSAYDVQHDGTIYVGSLSSSGTYSFAVYPPGSTTPSRTIPETIVPTAQQGNFAPNYMTVGPDGTLYVTEYSFIVGDPLAGLYIYPPNGAEKFVQTTGYGTTPGAGPTGIDVDASGNIYVANDNAGLDPNNGYAATTDTLHDIEVFAPGGTSVLRHITGTFTAYPVVVAPDGTLFFASFPSFADANDVNPVNGTFVVAPGSTTITQVAPKGETAIELYNGYEESAALRHRMSAQSMGASAAHAGAAAIRSYMRMTHRIR